jgi:hypothetical protein
MLIISRTFNSDVIVFNFPKHFIDTEYRQEIVEALIDVVAEAFPLVAESPADTDEDIAEAEDAEA